MPPDEMITCPACGGAGGGPFGRAGTSWDIETYECFRCQGAGVVSVAEEEARAIAKPGIAKTQSVRPDAAPKKRVSGES